MWRTAAAAAAVVVVSAAPAACSGGVSPPTVKLDGSVHQATDAGIVTEADSHHIVLDGKRRYRVDRRLIVFDPGTLQVAPLAGTVNRYALIGARDGLAGWIEPLSVVTHLPGQAPTVYFFGTLVRRTPAAAVFSDGTVLPVAAGVDVAGLPLQVRADLDPGTGKIRELVPS